MKILKSTNTAQNFNSSSRRVNGAILKYGSIDATTKTDEKESCIGDFTFSMCHKVKLNKT